MVFGKKSAKVAPEDVGASTSVTTASKEEGKNRLEAEERRCKDLLFLLLFVIFWGGMIYIAAFGFTHGKAARLLYGLDSHGYTCGVKNDNGPDLSNAKKLYFLDPLALQTTRSLTELKRAKKVCIPECPTVARSLLPTATHKVCSFSGLYTGGCEETSYYTCPYYQDSDVSTIPINTLLPGASVVPAWSTTYYSSFTYMVPGLSAACPVTPYGIANNATDPCGFKFTTKIIGEGPCFPNVFPTADVLNKVRENDDATLPSSVEIGMHSP